MLDRLTRAAVDWTERLFEPPARASSPLAARLVGGVRAVWGLRRVLLLLAVVITLVYSLPQGNAVAAAWIAGQVFTLSVTIALAIALAFAALEPVLPAGFTSGGIAALVVRCVVVCAAAAAGLEVGLRLLALLPIYPPAHVARADMLPPSMLLALTIMAGLWLLGALRERSRQVVEGEREALRARLEALQARTQPHFLFNSLNTLAGLIEEDPPRAVVALNKLAALLRHTLERSAQRTISLADEVDAARGFLELESLRYGERLRWAVELDPAAADAAVPPLCLQPLVENAIRHGLSDRREGVCVGVSARRAGRGVRIEVRDDGPGPGRSGRTGTGTALADLRRRLRLLYGDGASLEVTPADGGGCQVRLEIPPPRPTPGGPAAPAPSEERAS